MSTLLTPLWKQVGDDIILVNLYCYRCGIELDGVIDDNVLHLSDMLPGAYLECGNCGWRLVGYEQVTMHYQAALDEQAR